MKRSIRSFWEGELLIIEVEVCDGDRLVERRMLSVKRGEASPVDASAGQDNPVYGGYEEGEGRGAIMWQSDGQILVWGNGLLVAPPGWRLSHRGLPNPYGGYMDGAEITSSHPDGASLGIGDVISASGTVLIGLSRCPGTPGGPPTLTFVKPD